MPVQLTYPGVYSEIASSGVRSITGVSTSVTAFVGRSRRGSVDEPIRCFSFADFERQCGGLWSDSELPYAVQHYFANGGSEALISRVATGATSATTSVAGTDGGSSFDLVAANPGAWGANLRVTVSHGTPGEVSEAPAPDVFHLTLELVDPDLLTTNPAQAVLAREDYPRVSVDATASRFVERVVEDSNLARVTAVSVQRPVEVTEQSFGAAVDGGNGSVPDYEAAIGRLERAEIVNLLCVPPLDRDTDIPLGVLSTALDFATDHRAVLIVDPPQSWGGYVEASNLSDGYASLRSRNSAFYYPRIEAADALAEGRVRTFAPCGAIAGVIARTDASRGVYKAPAGLEATLAGVASAAVPLTDPENGILNAKGVNALRVMPIVGPVSWGARTGHGADAMASEWKYLPVVRTALYIESSLRRGVQWAVFEPNAEPLWSQLRQSIGTFMHGMFRDGAFAGTRPAEAYFVRCDGDTTTPDDVARGAVNILVGFAPLHPAEFVVLSIQQIAGAA